MVNLGLDEERPDSPTWRTSETPLTRTDFLKLGLGAACFGVWLMQARKRAFRGVDPEFLQRLNHEGEANAYFKTVTDQLANGQQVRASVDVGRTYIDGGIIIKNPLMFVGEDRHYTLMGFKTGTDGTIELLQDGTPEIVSLYMGDTTQSVVNEVGSYNSIMDLTVQLDEGRVVIADNELRYIEDALHLEAPLDIMIATIPQD